MSFFMGHQLRSFAIPAEKRPVTRYPGISISSKVISSRGRKTHSPALAGNIQTSPLLTLLGVYYPRSGLRQPCKSARAAHLRRHPFCRLPVALTFLLFIDNWILLIRQDNSDNLIPPIPAKDAGMDGAHEQYLVAGSITFGLKCGDLSPALRLL